MQRYGIDETLAHYRVIAPSMERCRRIWWRPPIKYDLLADAVYWVDEIPGDIDAYSASCLRPMLRYRTTLILGLPDAQWELYWSEAKRQFPRWIGFSRRRCQVDKNAIAFYYAVSEASLAETLEGVCMKLDCITDDSCSRRVIRLYGFDASQAAELHSAVLSLAEGVNTRVELHELPWVFAARQCRLNLVIGSWDAGVLQLGDGSYQCQLTPGTWDNVAGLIEPFAGGATGFQWLVDVPGEAAILLSANGQW
ncbi:MAG: hypothetical protein AB7U73_04355 [Pirellulales bacterium]